MPRKPKPPIPNMLIQGLSDHRTMQPERELQASEFVDDFTGEVHAVKPEVLAPTEPQYVRTAPINRASTGKLMRRDQARKNAQAAQRVVESVFMRKPTLRSNAKPGERSIRLGQGYELILQTPPWRRF